MLTRVLVSLSLLVFCVETLGDTLPKGVWVGSVGTRAITVCFNAGSRWGSYGSYYYLDDRKPIRLTISNNDSYWTEDGNAALWELADPRSGVIVGTWYHPEMQEFLPIKLGIVDGSDDSRACARDSYNSPLEDAPQIATGNVIHFSPGRSYRKLHFADQETIELFGPDAATSRINSFLQFDQSTERVRSYFQQRREFLGRIGYPGVDERHAEPVFWDAHFITIRFYLWAAGTGRSGISNEYRTWNVKTGEEVDLWQWIGASSSEPRLPPSLKKFMYQHTRESPESPECADGYRGQEDFTITLGKFGLHFDEEAWGDGCERSFFVSYEKLSPFLSRSGKRAVKSMRNRK